MRRRPFGKRVPTVVGAALVALLAITPIAAGYVAVRGDEPTTAADATPPSVDFLPSSGDSESRAPRQPVAAGTAPLVQKTQRAEALARKAAREAARKAREAARKAREAREAKLKAPFDLRIGSFNVLGSQHTAPGGDRTNFPPASARSVAAANLIAKHDVDIVGMQELQDDQLQALQSRTGMAAYPGLAWGTAETDNSILYDASRFELVSASKFTIPFMGRPRPQPIIRLKDRGTGREFYVVNTHPSAHDGPYLAERRSGQATLVSVVNDLRSTGLPVLVTGDMNDREEFYCRVVPAAALTAPNGGSYSSGCQPPPSPVAVDWVVGSGVSWSDYWRDTTPVTDRTSDHFFISADAHVG
jgi:endonuclease/exonuclease/phosphatase family metal-dependent hydrolase